MKIELSFSGDDSELKPWGYYNPETGEIVLYPDANKRANEDMREFFKEPNNRGCKNEV